jgi:hypothetical protein
MLLLLLLLLPQGLGKGLDDVLDTEELMNEADLTAALQQPTPKGRKGRGQKGAGSATPEKQAASELLGRSDSLSARERNKLKRKAKALERQSSVRLDNKGRVRRLAAYMRALFQFSGWSCWAAAYPRAVVSSMQGWGYGSCSGRQRSSGRGAVCADCTLDVFANGSPCRWLSCSQSSAQATAGKSAQQPGAWRRRQQQEPQLLRQVQQLCCQMSKQLSRIWRR